MLNHAQLPDTEISSVKKPHPKNKRITGKDKKKE